MSVAAADDRTVVAWSDTRHGNAETASQDIATSVVRPTSTVTEAGGVSGTGVLVAGVAGLLLGAGAALVGAVMVLRRGRRGRPGRRPAGA